MEEKRQLIESIISEMGSVAVALSGGVDSGLVAKIASDCLGNSAVALTAVSPSLASQEKDDIEKLVQDIGIRHHFLTSHETEDPRYKVNDTNRCYFCKTNVYNDLVNYAEAEGYKVLLDGTNADDVGDHRPGRRAAKEHGVRSPLQEALITKAEVRSIAKDIGLNIWDKPAAACLASRIPYGSEVTLRKLNQVEQSEAVLRDIGFSQYRVRHHGKVARIEVESHEIDIAIKNKTIISEKFKDLGFVFITIDLDGFRSGSMNEVI